MKLTVVCVFVGVFAVFVCDSSAQIGGPGLGWAIGQQASVSAVSLAIDGALAKADPATLPPELQVNETIICEIFESEIERNRNPYCLPVPLGVHRRSFNKFWKMPN